MGWASDWMGVSDGGGDGGVGWVGWTSDWMGVSDVGVGWGDGGVGRVGRKGVDTSSEILI